MTLHERRIEHPGESLASRFRDKSIRNSSSPKDCNDVLLHYIVSTVRRHCGMICDAHANLVESGRARSSLVLDDTVSNFSHLSQTTTKVLEVRSSTKSTCAPAADLIAVTILAAQPRSETAGPPNLGESAMMDPRYRNPHREPECSCDQCFDSCGRNRGSR
jgi:hypothetical protein